MSKKCTISNIDSESLEYITKLIADIRAGKVIMTDGRIEFICSNSNMAKLIDLHQRDIIRCDISYVQIHQNSKQYDN